MTRVWAITEGCRKGVKLMEHTFSDGSVHYSFDNMFKTNDVDGWEEAQMILANWSIVGMHEVTEECREAGWIA